MKTTRFLLAGLVAGLFICAATTFAAKESGKENTLTGQATCAKCALHETDKCQNVLQVTEDGKTVNYYLVGKASKAFHENVCHGPQKATATGVLKEKDGKKELAVSKIELVK